MQQTKSANARNPLSLAPITHLARALAGASPWRLARFGADGSPIDPDIAADHAPRLPVVVDGETIGFLALVPAEDLDVDPPGKAAGHEGPPGKAAGTALLASLVELVAAWVGALALARDSDNELSSLIEITRLLTSSVGISRILAIICEAAARAVEARAAVLWLLDDEHRYLRARALYPPQTDPGRLPPIPVEESPIDLEALGGDPVVLADAASDARIARWPNSLKRGLKSAVAVGLVGRGGPLGTLHVLANEPSEFSTHAIQLLTAIANQAAVCIEQANLEVDARDRERLAADLAAASQIQAALLPRSIPRMPGIELAVHFQPCHDVGGDLYDFIPIEKGNIGIAIGDATGKSVPGAIMMAMIRGGLRAYVEDVYHIIDILGRLNRAVHDATSGEHFMSLFYGVLNLAKRELTYTNAGHNAPLWFHQGVCTELSTGGIVLGADPQCRYEFAHIRLSPGEVVVFFTDGLTECADEAGQLFQKARVIEAVRPHLHRPADEILAALLANVDRFRGDAEPRDDLTVLVLRCK